MSDKVIVIDAAEEKGNRSIVVKQSAIECHHLWYDMMTGNNGQIFTSKAA